MNIQKKYFEELSAITKGIKKGNHNKVESKLEQIITIL